MAEEQLAIVGGTPIRTGDYPSRPWFDERERTGVVRCLEGEMLSGFVAGAGPGHLGGPEVRELEEGWRSRGQYAGAVAMNSATAGLHAGLVALRLPLGSEVVVPPLTMSATVTAVLMAGLHPRFADVDEDLFTLTELTVGNVLSDETRAILPVHLFGQMAPMAGLRVLAEKRGLKVLEDAAQAPGATQRGRWPGHQTAGAVFSFNQHKVITCGEGGMLVSDDDDVLDRARLVRNHGEVAVGDLHGDQGGGLVGFNYRLTELCAAVAQAQTEKLSQLNLWRLERAERLRAWCNAIDGLIAPVVHPGNHHVYFTFAVRFLEPLWGCKRDIFVAALRAEGIPCQPGYVDPLYRLPLLRQVGKGLAVNASEFPVSERLAYRELVLLPVCQYPASLEDIDKVGAALLKCWNGRAELRKMSA